MSVTTLVTAEQLLQMRDDPPYELVAGELKRITRPSPRHGDIEATLTTLLRIPGNAPAEMREKALAYLGAGARLVWVADPDSRIVTVYRSATELATLAEDADLDAAPVFPGFRCHIAELFA